ncbi:MAG TPA: YXWGXW repeat-containing protein [Candidatus Udaeobacter sp.]|nr:YXWGXW repeat-containing protein [Candidatus Udaeobacter sp.]
MKLRSFIFALFLFATLPLASSFAQVDLSVNVAPPVLPVYEQPPAPAPGYIWTPGYWGWATGGYYWVPGVWVAPPRVGLLWTPAWWGWNNGAYIFHAGYWGPTIGFYGGINYGHGYWGNGYWGGRWVGNTFHYNTAVTRVNNTVIHNTYVDRSVTTNEVNRTKTSFNGPNGVKAEATAEQKAAAENANKVPPTSQQLARQEAAAKDPKLQASNNKGHPTHDAVKSFNQSHGHATGGEALGTAGGAAKTENKPGNMAEHNPGGGKVGEAGNKHEPGNAHGNGQNLENNHAKAHSGKTMQHGNGAQGPHTMNQQMTHHQQMNAQQHQQQMGMQHHAPMGAGNRPHPNGGQQQGKKKGKP